MKKMKSLWRERFASNRHVFFSIKGILGDGHCIVNYFATFLGKATSEALNELWQEFCNNLEKYNWNLENMRSLSNWFNAWNSIYLKEITTITAGI